MSVGILQIFDKNNLFTSGATRKGLQYRIVRASAEDKQDGITIQKLVLANDTSLGRWDTPVAGHVDQGEASEVALTHIVRIAKQVQDGNVAEGLAQVYERYRAKDD